MSLNMKAFLDQLNEFDLPDLPYPYRHTDRALVKLFFYGLARGLTTYKTLHTHLLERPDVLRLVGLDVHPHRTTLSRRYKALSETFCNLLLQLSQRLTKGEKVDPTVVSLNSSLMHANGNIWHSKDLKAGVLPTCGNIDADARWGKSSCKG